LKSDTVIIAHDNLVRAATIIVDTYNKQDKFDELQSLFSDGLKKSMPQVRSEHTAHSIISKKGKFVQIGIPQQSGLSARFPLKAERGDWDLKITVTASGQISGIYFSDPQWPPNFTGRNSVPMRLPFGEEWTVDQGGSEFSLNNHMGSGSYYVWHAVDLVIRNEAGKTYSGDGTKNQDYFAYGKEVLAPADGTVRMVIGGVPDNRPGSRNEFNASGNAVVIEHSPTEFSGVFHLKPYSTRLKVGDVVRAGQAVGRCGNSGNSANPHLHFHIMSSYESYKALGITPYFSTVRVRRPGDSVGKIFKDYTPLRGDFISNSEL
jgi:murein DD-endopeptidase MepM/ murein hydrolase activator NlpD